MIVQWSIVSWSATDLHFALGIEAESPQARNECGLAADSPTALHLNAGTPTLRQAQGDNAHYSPSRPIFAPHHQLPRYISGPLIGTSLIDAMAEKIDIEASKNEDQSKSQVTRDKGQVIKVALFPCLRISACGHLNSRA